MSSLAGRKKLPKEQRRAQLLETAHRIVGAEGTDALTLARVAEQAGVTKPIAYEHFGTRAGLLMALYQDIDDRHVRTLREALTRAPLRLADVAGVAAAACMACYAQCGREAVAIAAALRGDDEMEAFHQTLLDSYVDLYCEILAPFSDLPARTLRTYCTGFIGAADAISQDLLRGRIGEREAADILASMMVAGISANRS